MASYICSSYFYIWGFYRTGSFRLDTLIKMWNSILIAGISYCTWQAAIFFIDFISEYYNQGRLSFLDGMLGYCQELCANTIAVSG